MDPDSLSLPLALCLLALMLWGALRAGSMLGRADTDEEQESPLGFPDSAAGCAVLLALLAGLACYFQLAYLRAQGLAAVAVPALLLESLAAVLLFSLGRARPRRPAGRLAAVLGRVLCAPAKWVFRAAHLSAEPAVTEDEVLSLVDDVEEQDLIDENQKEMISNIFELDDVTAGEIMTHRTEVVSVAEDTPAGQVVALAVDAGVSRMPVWRKNQDDIVGMVHVKDLFSLWNAPEKADTPAGELMRGAMFVPETCKARELLMEFKRRHTQIAVVVDEYGGTAGVVTMEDIMEEIVGNIQDEFDREEEEVVPCEGGVAADGGADLEDVFDALGLPMPQPDDDDEDGEPDFTTVGGLVADRLGSIPRITADTPEAQRPQVEWGGVLFTVLDADERRIVRVACTAKAPAVPGDDGDARPGRGNTGKEAK